MNPDQPWLTPETEWRGLVNRVRAGQPLRPPLWPDGARCAVALSFDCDHETFELGQGRAAIGRLAWGEYGRRRGVHHHFDLPETLVERELEAIIRQHVQQQERKGAAPEAPSAEDVTALRQEHRDEAARRVKLGLVLEAIAEKEGLTVTQDDLNAEIMRLASELKMPPADLVKMVKAGGQESIDELRARILADKALDFVYRNAVIQG